MIDLGTLRGLFEHEHALATYRQHGDRWAVPDLATMVAAGHGSRRLPLPALCQVCGDLGRLQVLPPDPARGPGGWMQLR